MTKPTGTEKEILRHLGFNRALCLCVGALDMAFSLLMVSAVLIVDPANPGIWLLVSLIPFCLSLYAFKQARKISHDIEHARDFYAKRQRLILRDYRRIRLQDQPRKTGRHLDR
jgi:hypothetical protein